MIAWDEMYECDGDAYYEDDDEDADESDRDHDDNVCDDNDRMITTMRMAMMMNGAVSIMMNAGMLG